MPCIKQTKASWLLLQSCEGQRLACCVSHRSFFLDRKCGKVAVISSLAPRARILASLCQYGCLDNHLLDSHLFVVSQPSTDPRHSGRLWAVRHQVLILGVCNFDSGASQTELWKSMNYLNNMTLHNKSPHTITTQDAFKNPIWIIYCSGSSVSFLLSIAVDNWKLNGLLAWLSIHSSFPSCQILLLFLTSEENFDFHLGKQFVSSGHRKRHPPHLREILEGLKLFFFFQDGLVSVVWKPPPTLVLLWPWLQ